MDVEGDDDDKMVVMSAMAEGGKEDTHLATASCAACHGSWHLHSHGVEDQDGKRSGEAVI